MKKTSATSSPPPCPHRITAFPPHTREKKALPIITSQCPDLILLDLGLPDMDGMEIIRQVRTWSSIPIIVLSARTQEQEKVRALDLGADDYLTKPIGTSELLARIRTALRHSNRLNTASPLYKAPIPCKRNWNDRF